MEQDLTQAVREVLTADRDRIAQTRPELVTGYLAFKQSYAAYEKMTEQFQANEGPIGIAAAGVFRTS